MIRPPRQRNGNAIQQNLILDRDTDSTARVVYKYFGGAGHFPNVSTDIIEAVDKSDSA